MKSFSVSKSFCHTQECLAGIAMGPFPGRALWDQLSTCIPAIDGQRPLSLIEGTACKLLVWQKPHWALLNLIFMGGV